MLCQNNHIAWRKHKNKNVLVQQQLSLHYHSCKKGLIRNSGRERTCKWLGPCLKWLGTLSLPLSCLWGPIRQSSVSDVLLGALITIKLPLLCLFQHEHRSGDIRCELWEAKRTDWKWRLYCSCQRSAAGLVNTVLKDHT